MRRTLVAIVCCMGQLLFAADEASLQRGARFYMNYCSGCHALKYMRVQTLEKGLGLDERDAPELLPLLFLSGEMQETIQTAMPLQEATQWFGVAPPDLSLVARARGSRWLYDFLKGFYADEKRPFGANNLVFPDVAMPDVLYPLRGEVKRGLGETLVLVKTGSMEENEFNQNLNDLIHFLVYTAEPHRDERRKIGILVLIFLAVLLVLVRSLQILINKKSSRYK